MKKSALLGLTLIMVFMMPVLPVSAAKKAEFRANGKVTSYYGYDPNDPNLDAMVVGGNWNVYIKGYDIFDPLARVDFKLFYRELNLGPGESAPAGTVDQFRITLVQTEIFRYAPGLGCIIVGHFNVDKLAWLPEGSTPPIDHKYNFLGIQYGMVFITPTGLDFIAGPWHLVGSTTTMTMK